MARVTVEDCVDKIPNRYELLMVAAQRAKDLAAGAPLTVARDNDKNSVVALREIADETVSIEELQKSLVMGLQKYVEVEEPEEEEMEIISTNAMRRIQKDVNVVAEKEVISWLREQIPQVEVTEEVKRYMLDITRKTREEDLIELGVSPRAGQMLFSAAQTLALLNGRSYVVPEDVQALVHDVLDHRIILKPQSRGRGITTHEVIADIVNNTVVPR